MFQQVHNANGIVRLDDLITRAIKDGADRKANDRLIIQNYDLGPHAQALAAFMPLFHWIPPGPLGKWREAFRNPEMTLQVQPPVSERGGKSFRP